MRRLIAAMLLVGVLGTEAMAEKKTAAPATKTAQTNVADRTGNISKRHREDLLRKIMEIREFFNRSDDKNAVRLRQFADLLAREVRGKKYGLVFEEHRERADVELESNLPILKENAKRFIDHGGEMNFLIEGENLAALKLLEKTHRNRIDFIYIDPPYNRGKNDFIYNDNYIEKMDLFRHSKWLSFMEKRLRIARELLSSRGVLFISIDDNEQAALKILCDEIFGAANFIAQMIWQQGKKSSGNLIGVNHEYVLVYAKCRAKIDSPKLAWKQKKGGLDRIYKKYAQLRKKYRKDNATIEEEMKKWFAQLPENDPAFDSKHYSCVDDKGLFFPDNSCAPDHPETRCHKPLIHPVTGKETAVPSLGWRWKEETLDQMVKDGLIYYGDDETCVPKVKKYLTEMEYELPSSAFYRDGRGASNELKKLMGGAVFENPKDCNEIMRFISFRPNAIVLDFFAGSGTTGHAVMRLNAQDGGRRRFILVTDNENGICENVTYERLKRAIKNEDLKARLKYMKIGYLPITEKLYYEYADDLLKNVRELVELENAVDFAHDASIAIVQSDAEYAAFLADEKRLAACRVLYVGHHVLRSAASEATLSARNVELREIPQYYYPELED